jgi:plastocyanin
MNHYRTITMVVITLILTGIAGCISQKPEPVIITIDMTEYAFTPNRLDLKVGQQVTLNLVNNGQIAHEIMFGRGVEMMNGVPAGYQMDLFMQAGVEPEVMGVMEEGEHMSGHQSHSGFMILLNESGESATVTFTVTDQMLGEWEIGCFEQDGVHYTAGMIGTLIVAQ